MTYTPFGSTIVICLDPVSSKDLQVKLELLHDRKNGITEHLETSFGGFLFSKIFNLMQVFYCVDQKMPNILEVDCSVVVYHKILIIACN